MSDFNPGDVVKLKSAFGGEYHMTVEGHHITSGGALIRAVWFDIKNRLQRDNFSHHSLQLIQKNLNYVEPEQKVQECNS